MLVHVLGERPVQLVADAMDLEAVVAEAAQGVAALRARAGRARGVQEEVHAPVAIKVGHKDLLHVGQLAPAARVARELRVGQGGVALAPLLAKDVVNAHGEVDRQMYSSPTAPMLSCPQQTSAVSPGST